MLVVLAACAAACVSGLPNPKINVRSDLSGKSYTLGAPLHLEWECDDCDRIVGTSVVVLLWSEERSESSRRVAFGPITGSADWNTATDMSGRRVEPGLYRLWFESYPQETGTNSLNENRNATGVSGVFRLAP